MLKLLKFAKATKFAKSVHIGCEMLNSVQLGYHIYAITYIHIVQLTRPDVPDGVVAGNSAKAQSWGHGGVRGVRKSGPEADEGPDSAHVHQGLFELVVEEVLLTWLIIFRQRVTWNDEIS